MTRKEFIAHRKEAIEERFANRHTNRIMGRVPERLARQRRSIIRELCSEIRIVQRPDFANWGSIVVRGQPVI